MTSPLPHWLCCVGVVTQMTWGTWETTIVECLVVSSLKQCWKQYPERVKLRLDAVALAIAAAAILFPWVLAYLHALTSAFLYCWIVAFITWNSNLLPLLKGLCSSNPCRFELTVFFLMGVCRNWTDDLVIDSPALWPPVLVLHRLWGSLTRWHTIHALFGLNKAFMGSG